MKTIKRYAVASLLLPGCYGVSVALWHLLGQFKDVPEGSFYFFLGMGAYFAFQWAFFKPIRTYVFGHELTHALAAWVTGGQVKHFHVSKKGGSVSVSKSNFFIALAPYMVPLYTVILLAALLSMDHFYPLREYWRWCLLVLGMSFGFHIALTAFALQQDQPDLKTSGTFLSGVIIFLGNAVSIVLLLGIIFPRTVSWNHFARTTGQHTVIAMKEVGHGLAKVPPLVQKFAGTPEPVSRRAH